jgi:DNA-binding CsgD family transcriptional regulator
MPNHESALPPRADYEFFHQQMTGVIPPNSVEALINLTNEYRRRALALGVTLLAPDSRLVVTPPGDTFPADILSAEQERRALTKLHVRVGRLYGLTEEQLETASFVGHGLSDEEIAGRVHRAVDTIKTRTRVVRKIFGLARTGDANPRSKVADGSSNQSIRVRFALVMAGLLTPPNPPPTLSSQPKI